MTEYLIITPVKNSIETTLESARAIKTARGTNRHIIYNDFSTTENKDLLEQHQAEIGYELVHLEDITDTPSPNYRLVLQIIQQKALELNVPLILVESDVIVKPETLNELYKRSQTLENCGMIASITVDTEGNVNFPYLKFKSEKKPIVSTRHSLSFCCTLLTPAFLKKFSFQNLSSEKDWYDVFISHQSTKLGFQNYVCMDLPVVHKPHSSRPWKMLKYTNPLKYYFLKYTRGKDRI